MSEYFDYTSGRLATGTRARSTAVNTIFDLISAGFDKFPTEIELKLGKTVFGTDAGAANAYVVTLPYTPTAYSDGMMIAFKAGAASTGASTIDVNSLGVKSLTKQSGAALIADDIFADKMVVAMYNATSGNFEIISSVADAANAAAVIAVATLTAGSGVVISSNDTTVGYLNGKLVAGEGMDLTEGNDGGDETLTVSGEDASAINKGIVELATDAETVTGTDTARACTPANVTAKMAAPGAIGETTPNTIKLTNTGLKLLDTGADHYCNIKINEDLSGNKTLSIVLADGDRSLTLNENFVIGGGFDVTITAEDAAGVIVLDNCGLEVEDTTNAGNKIKIINATSDDDKVVTLNEGVTIGDGHVGTFTFSGASKTMTVEDDSIVNQDLTTDATPQFTRVRALGLYNGTQNIDLPTNGMAAAKFMLGNSNTIAWFYLNTAPPGWKSLATGADTVLGVAGGAQAYNVNGGNPGGTWTQPSHTLATSEMPAHTHVIIRHHTGTGGSNIAPTEFSATPSTHRATESTGGGGAHSHGTTYRPSASVGKLFQLDTA